MQRTLVDGSSFVLEPALLNGLRVSLDRILETQSMISSE